MTDRRPIDDSTPTRGAALLFRAKATVLQARRALEGLAGSAPLRHPLGEGLRDAPVLAESRTQLWSIASGAERILELGKVHNLRLSVRRVNGIEVPAGAVFSFWSQIGRASRWAGYVAGRELREGCVIPAVGGGICQLSNALYDAARRAGFEIVERHRHTRVIPGSLAERDRDATVFWNYVDLRFRGPSAFRIEAFLTRDELVVALRGRPPATREVSSGLAPDAALQVTGDCATCDADHCFRKASVPRADSSSRTAYLVDELWPELDAYLSASRVKGDVLGLPLDGRRRRRPGYAWSTEGFARVGEAKLVTLRRSLRSRRLAAQGAARQRALLRFDRELASALARLLTPDVTRVVVAQGLLPHLWVQGQLGGREFDVLMTRLPLAQLEARLDSAKAAHPMSTTLADFRASAWIVRAETEALARARAIVTPHSEIAGLFEDRVVRLPWQLPAGKTRATPGELVGFAGPTVGRKGAYELRRVADELGLGVAVAGSVLEEPAFWEGVRHERRGAEEDWLAGTAVVAAPAWVEHRPRRLLEAVARGIPVVASEACGLRGVTGVVEVPTGDLDALRDALSKLANAGTR